MDKKSQEADTPWDFYLYVGLSLLHWDLDFFLKATPNLWLKSYIVYLRQNNPESLDLEDEKTIYAMDQVPLWQ